MKIKKNKKLQLTTLLLLILTILFMSTGLMLINISNYFDYIHFDNSLKLILRKTNGFKLLNIFSINYILVHSANLICWFTQNNKNYYNWIQLQIGIIFCIILVPILIFIITSLTFLNIGLKIKIKNNNFWDAIQNCEIINNYYIHINRNLLNVKSFFYNLFFQLYYQKLSLPKSKHLYLCKLNSQFH